LKTLLTSSVTRRELLKVGHRLYRNRRYNFEKRRKHMFWSDKERDAIADIMEALVSTLTWEMNASPRDTTMNPEFKR
jgi:hypothetical protein